MENSDSNNFLACVLCELEVNSNEELKLHMQLHKGEKPFFYCNTHIKAAFVLLFFQLRFFYQTFKGTISCRCKNTLGRNLLIVINVTNLFHLPMLLYGI